MLASANLAAAALKMSSQDHSMFDRIKQILRSCQFIPDPRFPDRFPPPFHSKGFKYAHEDGVQYSFTGEKLTARIEGFCIKLFDCIGESGSSMARLDDQFSELLDCKFRLSEYAGQHCNQQSSCLENEIAGRALQLLSRLPDTPLELPESSVHFSSRRWNSRSPETGLNATRWEDSNVAPHVSTNVIRLALCIQMYPWIARGKLSEHVNHIATLLDTATKKYTAVKMESAKQKWVQVRTFLWASWQRSLLLYFSILLAQHLQSGVDDEASGTAYILQSCSPVPGMSVQELSKRYASNEKSRYMCSWAFELLRSNPVCIGMDFRRFHLLYSKIFDDKSARCISNNATSACEGDHPHSCQRFVGMVIRDQSAHEPGCTGCKSLMWDESSYRSTPGARAVSPKDTDDTKLRYRTASEKTLAISHVWSHGQGGRPETGMNHCLHKRFSTIATKMGCDTYWMDTPCIPTDHVLRREAISNINKVFAGSRVTLICDRDLMEIEIEGGDASVELCESILVTTIVCDWNVRAWTFLEAFRARQSIHLLCKDHKVVSLKECLDKVHREGSLDVAVLLLATPHLMPRVYRDDNGEFSADAYPLTRDILKRSQPLFQGFLTVENSGMLLSHRPASRPGDDIVIWSLLLNEKVHENAIDFWRSREGHSIHTSFLVSTAPRLNIWRFGWAPSSPRLFSNGSAKSKTRSMGFSDVTSKFARMTAEGLRAKWLIYDVGSLKQAVSKISFVGKLRPASNKKSICEKFLNGYRWAWLLRPLLDTTPFDDVPAVNTEDWSRILVVVCATNDPPGDNTAWEWRGVHEWDLKEPLPKFRYSREILLV